LADCVLLTNCLNWSSAAADAAGGQRGDGDGTGHRQCRAGCHDQAAQVQGAGLRSARAESVSGIVHVIRFLLDGCHRKVAAGATVAGLLGVLLMTGRNAAYSAAFGTAGTRISRLPLDCMATTALLHLLQQARRAVVADAQ
jgi:hypothetical protein